MDVTRYWSALFTLAECDWQRRCRAAACELGRKGAADYRLLKGIQNIEAHWRLVAASGLSLRGAGRSGISPLIEAVTAEPVARLARRWSAGSAPGSALERPATGLPSGLESAWRRRLGEKRAAELIAAPLEPSWVTRAVEIEAARAAEPH